MGNEITEAQINKITAEFIGIDILYNKALNRWEYAKVCKRLIFTESLDALMPVWKKLGEIPNLHITSDGMFSAYFMSMGDMIRAKAKTIQLAAALATCKAILELQESKNKGL